MRTSITLALASTAASLVVAAPFSFPLSNGFPNLNATSMAEVYKLAGGTLPNGALPTNLKPDAVKTLQLIAANELFEVAYFTELLYNVTSGVPGYQVENYDYVVSTLTAVINVSFTCPVSPNSIQKLIDHLARTGPRSRCERHPCQCKERDYPTLQILLPGHRLRLRHRPRFDIHRSCAWYPPKRTVNICCLRR